LRHLVLCSVFIYQFCAERSYVPTARALYLLFVPRDTGPQTDSITYNLICKNCFELRS